MNENIIIFYHVAQLPRWEYLFQQQINALLVSELYEHAKSIEICLNSPFKLSYSLPFMFTKFNVHINDNIISEADTLKRMWEFANNSEENYKILYFHTKGISYHFEKEALNVDGWRLYLEYFNIHKWKKCIELLSYYDCVGTDFNYNPTPYYAENKQFKSNTNKGFYNGNFWWANSNYIKTLDPNYLYDYESEMRLNKFSLPENCVLSETDKLNIVRFNSELWIGTNNPNEFSLGKSNFEIYEQNAMGNLEHFEKIYKMKFEEN